VSKLLSIAGATFLGLRLGVGTLPAGVSRGQVWGLAAIGGIGSLFRARLAYHDPQTVGLAKVRIFAGSIVSGLLGAPVLIILARRAPNQSGDRSSARLGADGGFAFDAP
jgi:NhaA family Na+:H+ antiporter